jgi:hypothetical protein
MGDFLYLCIKLLEVMFVLSLVYTYASHFCLCVYKLSHTAERMSLETCRVKSK